MIVGETQSAVKAVVGECHSKVPEEGLSLLVLPGKDAVLSLVSARFSNMDGNEYTSDLVALAEGECQEARHQQAGLFQEHVLEMGQLNKPGIEVGGNLELARLINASLYVLMGSLRNNSIWSGAPEGLVSTRYEGHAFWDVETWQYPTWLAFWPEIALTCLRYREHMMLGATINAARPMKWLYGKAGRVGHDGLRFPWESATTGLEMTENENTKEDHIQGDISLAFQQYWYATGNTSWLKESGFPVIEGIAKFYASRVMFINNSYHMIGTMGADEYHDNVTDSAFGNAMAKTALMAAYLLAESAGREANSTFKAIAAGLEIPYDSNLDYHPEFKGYNRSDLIKQADAVLMSYPLNVPMNLSTKLNDLLLYASRQDVNGVAMTWPIQSMVALDVGDEEKAAFYFKQSYEVFARPPFYSWHEGNETEGSDKQGAPNLLTAAGGFLQAVWAGYGGIRFQRDGKMLITNPRPLPNSTYLRLRHLHFKGTTLHISATEDGWSVVMQVPTMSQNLNCW